MPKISVITINYNNASGLKQTIESVVAKLSEDIEYLVIDGGSKDDSKQVIEQYSDKITYWVSEPDQGIYHAMNKGIEAAKGTHLQFLNSGDMLDKEFRYSEVLSSLESNVLLYGNMLKVWPDGRKVLDKKTDTDSFFTFFDGTINHSPSFIPKVWFEKYGNYDQTKKIVADWQFFVEAVGLGGEKVKYIDCLITVFDMTGISNQNGALDKTEREDFLRKKLPSAIYQDYELYSRDIDRMKRIKKSTLAFFAVNLIERFLFKLEKWKLRK